VVQRGFTNFACPDLNQVKRIGGGGAQIVIASGAKQSPANGKAGR
jgi:hypothetical protein